MVRTILAVVGGLLLAMVVLTVGEAVGRYLFPLPPDLGLNPEPDPRAVAARTPAILLFFVVLMQGAAAFAGSAAAVAIARAGPRPGWIVAGLFLLAAVLNVVLIPHPVWFVLGSLVLVILCGWAAARLVGGADPLESGFGFGSSSPEA